MRALRGQQGPWCREVLAHRPGCLHAITVPLLPLPELSLGPPGPTAQDQHQNLLGRGCLSQSVMGAEEHGKSGEPWGLRRLSVPRQGSPNCGTSWHRAPSTSNNRNQSAFSHHQHRQPWPCHSSRPSWLSSHRPRVTCCPKSPHAPLSLETATQPPIDSWFLAPSLKDRCGLN